MKKILLSLLIVTSALFISCDKDDSEGLSRVTNYPTITINGNSVVVINSGDTYTDQGAVAMAGSTELTINTQGSVDSSTPGVYKITYSSSNSDGFDASATRTVIVLSTAPSAYNFEGTFTRNGNPNNVVRISDRVYTADNAGGVAHSAANDPNFLFVTFYNYDDLHVYIPPQLTPSGIFVESTSGDILSNDNFRWVLAASSFYGSAVRNFIR